jgi:hypothetical protein
MQVAAFDRSQIRHTRHMRPVRLEVELTCPDRVVRLGC